MVRNTSKFLHLLALLAAFGIVPAAQAAAPKDKEAAKLNNQAIMVEYLGTQFEAAEATLRKALDLCNAAQGNCSPKVQAQIHRDMGVVLITGLGRLDDGKLEFAQALQLNPGITLDEDLTTDDVKAAFEEVKAGMGAEVPGIEPGVEPVPGIGSVTGAEGDILHQPPPEGATMTPLPLYAELPADMITPTVKFTLRYKPFGAQRWKTMTMEKYQNGFSAQIPCLDISSITGELKYFIQATDGGDIVANSGSRKKPHTVMIKTSLEGDPPRLPGKPAPAQCGDVGGGEVPDCFDDDDCGTNATCEDGKCIEGEAPDARGPVRKNWLSAGFQAELLMFKAQTDVCSASDEYTCFWSDGTLYEPTPEPGIGNQINGGMGLGTMRVLLGYDRVLFDGLAVGGRAGFAFGGGPTKPGGAAFFPWHAELRGAWWFFDDPFRRSVRLYAMLSGGMMQVDGKVVVVVRHPQDVASYYPNELPGRDVMLEAWTKKGLFFAALGGGAMVAITPNFGPYVEAKIGQLFPASGTFIGLQGGFTFGM